MTQVFGKEEVTSSSLVNSSRKGRVQALPFFCWYSRDYGRSLNVFSALHLYKHSKFCSLSFGHFSSISRVKPSKNRVNGLLRLLLVGEGSEGVEDDGKDAKGDEVGP